MDRKNTETERQKQAEALVIRAKNGDEAAFSDLLAAYSPLFDAMALQFSKGLPDEERKDLRQEAVIAFYLALVQYVPERGVAFGYFAKRCIRNRLIDYLRRMEKQTVEAEPSAPEAETEDVGRTILERERFLALCEQIRGILSDYENRIWTLVISGLTAAEIAEMTGADRKSVENALARVRRKLRKELSPH